MGRASVPGDIDEKTDWMAGDRSAVSGTWDSDCEPQLFKSMSESSGRRIFIIGMFG
jgi:hypothetical protein